ncbi:hypothetical protein [Weissella confusa]|uniref:hypothetical protein n=1 Tax=Weissella confusa TaxID=1583 RepID=UPI00107EEEF1|nr:hypothetical protein [Weissella confusa]TGE76486.1 hypothetical protein C6P10_05780 [Weissella confusa]
MSSGKKQHYMSATAISQFSYEAKADKPNREKRVHLKLIESDVVLDQKASDVLKKKNLYTLTRIIHALNF